MIQTLFKNCWTLIITFLITINLSAQEMSSDEILNSIYENFATSTFEEQYQSLKELRDAAKKENHDYNYNFALTNLSIYAFDSKDYLAFTKYTEEAYAHWMSHDLNRERVYYSGTQAVALENLKGNKKKALEIYYIMLDQLKKDTTSVEYLSDVYAALAADYRSIGDLESALNNNVKSIQTLKVGILSDDDINLSKGNIENIQGLIYYDQKDYENAISRFLQSIDFLEKYDLDYARHVKNEWLIQSYNGLIKSYLEVGKLEEAAKYITITRKFQESFNFHKYFTTELEGQMELQKGNYERAKQLFDQALNLALTVKVPNKKFPKEARITKRQGNLKMLEGDFKGALMSYQDALKYIDDSVSDDLNSNPNVEAIIHQRQALEILNVKANVSAKLIDEDYTNEFFKISLDAYQAAVELLDEMKVDYLNQDTRYFIASQANVLYNEYLQLLSANYRKTGNKELISEIYNVCEKNKSSIAFDELQYKFALANSKIPESLKGSHGELKLEIAHAERLLEEEKKVEKPDAGKISELENQIFNLNEEFIALDQKLNREYGDELKERQALLETPSMSQIQQVLGNEDLFIETFQASDKLLLIAFDAQESFVLELPDIELSDDIESYIQAIGQRPDVPLNENTDLITTSNNIYKALLKPILDKFPNKQRLVVVPDGILSSLPFESLIANPSEPNQFLLNNYNIAYLYASRQLLDEVKIDRAFKVLSLAPKFDNNFENVRSCNRDSLSRLPYARKESEYVSGLFEGTFLHSRKVKKEEFLSNIKEHQVIHLATHACLNETDPMLNEIHFSDSYITNREIESQLVSPELIVLGACNTANGKYIEGEGLLSLSKGFLQSGAKCIQSSLWEIDDYASSEIIKQMFANLKEGKSKSESLRAAKLDYLAEANNMKQHPYYWAGIVQFGVDGPLVGTKSVWFSNQFTLLAMLLILGIGLFFYYKSRAKNQ